jgi:hypothetical protein
MTARRLVPLLACLPLLGLVATASAKPLPKLPPSTTSKLIAGMFPTKDLQAELAKKVRSKRLLSKAKVAETAGVPASALAESATVSAAVPNAGGLNIAAGCPLLVRTQADSPRFSFYNWNRVDRSPVCERDWVALEFNVAAGKRYVVECVTTQADWEMNAAGNGDTFAQTGRNTEHPVMTVDPTRDGQLRVEFSATGTETGMSIIDVHRCRVTPADRTAP